MIQGDKMKNISVPLGEASILDLAVWHHHQVCCPGIGTG